MEGSSTKDELPCVGSTSDDIMEEFSYKSWRTDVTLKVEDRPLYVSKHVLGTVSPVFEAMFNVENTNDALHEIPLPGKKYRDVLEFLRCIYPNVLKPVTEANVLIVLPLAVEYEVTNLKKSCETYLLKHIDGDTSTEKLCIILNTVHTLNMQKIFEKCMEIVLTRHREDFDTACAKVPLSGDIKSSILTKMCSEIDTKYQTLLNENQSGRTLCSFLGIVANRSPFVHRFLLGKVTIKSFSFEVEYPYDKSFDIEFGQCRFSIRFNQTTIACSNPQEVNIFAFIKCCYMDREYLKCSSCVVLKSCMTEKNDFVNESIVYFKRESEPLDKEMKIFVTKTQTEEIEHFILNGVSNFEIYFFIEH